MIPELLNYKVSFLNPVLKVIVPLLFLFGAFYFYRARNLYGGELGKVVRRLAFAGIVGFLAMSIRLLGDYVTLWKWGESLGYLVFGVVSVYAVWPLLTFVKKSANASAEPRKEIKSNA